MLPIDAPGPAAFQFMPQGFGLSGAGKGLSLNIPDQTDNTKSLRPILFHPPCQVLESRAVKFQVSQWLRPARDLVDAFGRPGAGASSLPTLGGRRFPVQIRFRATKRSVQSRRSALRSDRKRTGLQLPSSTTVYFFSGRAGSKTGGIPTARGSANGTVCWNPSDTPRNRGPGSECRRFPSLPPDEQGTRPQDRFSGPNIA